MSFGNKNKMTLKNKDGSVYRLRSPNALMKDQTVWNGYTIHNMKWDPITQESKDEVTPMSSDFSVRDSFVEELESNKPPMQDAEPKSPVESPKFEERKHESKGVGLGVETTFVWCLPAVLKKKRDSLYDEEYVTVSYGNPYSFEAVMVEEGDLSFSMWTTATIERGSVVFPKTTFKRWWRVDDIRDKTGGFLYSGMPSDYQPHFEI